MKPKARSLSLSFFERVLLWGRVYNRRIIARCLEQEITCREEAEKISALKTQGQVQYLRKVAELWEDIHVAETIDGNYGAVSGGLLNVQ